MRFPNSHPERNVSTGACHLSGFSLLEILTVVCVMSLLAGLSIPAISSIGRSQHILKAATDITELLEMARTHARASNARVEVGFGSDAAGLRVVVIAAREGSTFTPVSRVLRFPQVRLDSAMAGGRPSPDIELAGTPEGLLPGFESSGQQFDRIIEFNSRGEARALSTGLSRRIEIGLLPNINGFTPENLKQSFAAIQVLGLSGGIEVFRL
jgi:type II secretory pathway pseudopilin PulG